MLVKSNGGVTLRSLHRPIMKKRRNPVNQDDDIHIVFENANRPQTLLSKLRRWIGELLLWFIACFVPLLLIGYGAVGIHNRHIPAWQMRKEKFCDDALAFSWVTIAIGIWGLGYVCGLKTGRAVFNVLGCVLAVTAAAVGVWYMLKK